MSRAEHELKFWAPPGHGGLIRQRLATTCSDDPRVPGGAVSSIYFDTPSFDLLRDKLDGHRDKRKVRVRWYDGSASAFVEVKYRFGAARDKLRIESQASPWQLSRGRLEQVDASGLLEPLRGAGVRLPVPLHPMMTIRFRRTRFVDPLSGSRVALDDDIRVVDVNRCFFPGCPPHPLPFVVVEVKGPAARLPVSLRTILGLDVRRASVSKYAACYRQLRRI